MQPGSRGEELNQITMASALIALATMITSAAGASRTPGRIEQAESTRHPGGKHAPRRRQGAGRLGGALRIGSAIPDSGSGTGSCPLPESARCQAGWAHDRHSHKRLEPTARSGATDAPIAAAAGIGVISRRGLYELLGHAGRVTLVSAPAGRGKTVLLRSWVCAMSVAVRAVWVADPRRGDRPGQGRHRRDVPVLRRHLQRQHRLSGGRLTG
jgi:hypothetical protein